jgi:hypothetical protein
MRECEIVLFTIEHFRRLIVAAARSQRAIKQVEKLASEILAESVGVIS